MDIKTLYHYWVTIGYLDIVNGLKNNGCFDEDTLHDTFLDVHDSIMAMEDKNISLSELSKMFLNAYKQNFYKRINYDKQFIHFDLPIFEIIISEQAIDDESEDVYELNAKKMCLKILRYVQNTFSSEDSDLFNLHARNQALSTNNLSRYTGIPAGTVYGRLNRMKSSIRQNVTIHV